MADWYVSSAAYAALAAFASSHPYNVGDIVVPTSPALKAKWVFRCTTAGTSGTEPAWPTANNATVTTSGATFTNVTGQSTYGWGAAAGDICTLNGSVGAFRFAAGDRMFVSSDHSETQTSSPVWGNNGATASFTGGQVLSVSRAGSVPPIAADLLAGATCFASATNGFIDAAFPLYHYGITYQCSGNSGLFINSSGFKGHYFDACQLYLSGAATTAKICNNAATRTVLNNTTLRFSHISQSVIISSGPWELIWQNTASALAGAIFPGTTLFSSGSNATTLSVTMRGVDISALTAVLALNGGDRGPLKVLLDSCKIASGVTRYNNSSVTTHDDIIELVNCYNGTNFISECYQPSGAVTTEFTITLTGGATDDVGTFSHKMVSNANVDKLVAPLSGFWMDIENTAVGSSKTATVEIISSTSLNNDEISLLLEYQGTSSSSLASLGSSLPTTVLTAAAAVTTSTATWNSSPSTPVKQKLQVTFTPQVAGRVRGQVRLGKASATVYVNPVITVT